MRPGQNSTFRFFKTTTIGFIAMVLALAFVVLPPQPAHATIAVKLELADLVEQSDVIAVGTVAKAESRWTDDQRLIVTDVTIDVGDGLLGCSDGESVTFTVMGGTVGDISQTVAGEAIFRSGEKAVVFLGQRPSGHLGVIGLSQGKYHVEAIPGDDLEVAAPNLGDLTLAEVESVDPSTGKQTVKAIDVPAHVEPIPLKDLTSQIETLIQARRGEQR